MLFTTCVRFYFTNTFTKPLAETLFPRMCIYIDSTHSICFLSFPHVYRVAQDGDKTAGPGDGPAAYPDKGQYFCH